MQGVAYVDAVPPARLEGEVHKIAGLGQNADDAEEIRQRNSDPLGDVRPSFFARNLCYLVVDGKGLEIGEGERCGPCNHAIDR